MMLNPRSNPLVAFCVVTIVSLLCAVTSMASGVTPITKVFGHSASNRPMVAYVLGAGPNVTMVFGAFHGDERQTPDAIWELIKYLEVTPTELRSRTVVLVPIANPD